MYQDVFTFTLHLQLIESDMSQPSHVPNKLKLKYQNNKFSIKDKMLIYGMD